MRSIKQFRGIWQFKVQDKRGKSDTWGGRYKPVVGNIRIPNERLFLRNMDKSRILTQNRGSKKL